MKSRAAKRQKYTKAQSSLSERERISAQSSTFSDETRALADAFDVTLQDGPEHVIKVSAADVERLAALLRTPPPPNRRLNKAFARYRERVLSDTEYLLSSPANAEHLDRSISQFRNGAVKRRR